MPASQEPDPPEHEAVIAPGFAELLTGFELDLLADDPATTYGVFAGDYALGYMNRAWFRFATQNAGDAMLARFRARASIVPAIPASLRPFYLAGFARALATGVPWEHVYACHSPDEHRVYRMTVLPLDRRGLLISHAVVEKGPIRDATAQVEDVLYTGKGRLVVMCAHCRRTRRVGLPEGWDWVPAHVADPPRNVSHGLCSLCLSYYHLRRLPPAPP
jgi:hypothetical protein